MRHLGDCALLWVVLMTSQGSTPLLSTWCLQHRNLLHTYDTFSFLSIHLECWIRCLVVLSSSCFYRHSRCFLRGLYIQALLVCWTSHSEQCNVFRHTLIIDHIHFWSTVVLVFEFLVHGWIFPLEKFLHGIRAFGDFLIT